MIFYFSGTGNSLHAATRIAQAHNERLVSIAEASAGSQGPIPCILGENELLGFVFPVHAWAPPGLVLGFIRRLQVSGGQPYVFSICTCGDEEGRSTRILARCLKSRGLALDSAFALRMPNNFIISFDKDSEALERQKLDESERRIETISAVLRDRRRGVFQPLPGRWPRLKSGLVNPLFRTFATDPHRFCATDACNGCGLCEAICPIHTITRTGRRGRPVWGQACTMCLACLSRCPTGAIQYGKGTVNRLRYVHPDLRPQTDALLSSAPSQEAAAWNF